MKKLFLIIFAFFLGVQLYSSVTWSTPPTNLSTGGVNASNPQTGMDSSGNAVAIWLESGVIKSKNYTANTMTWGAIDSVPSSGATNPCLVVDQNGNATAIWLESGVVRTSYQPSGGGWGAASSLSLTGSSNPALAIDISGNVVAVWTIGGIIQSATRLFGGSWPLLADALVSSSADKAQVAIGADGTVVAVWQQVVSSVNTIYTATKTISGSWGASSTQISTTGTQSINPKVAVDTSGNALAIWYTYQLSGTNYSNVFLRSSYHLKTGNWTTPTITSLVGTFCNPSNYIAKVSFDDSGKAIGVWTNSADCSSFSLIMATYNPKVGWMGYANIVAQDLYANSFDLVCNSVGTSAITLSHYLALNKVVIASVETNTATFAIPILPFIQIVSDTTSNSAYPKVSGSIVGSNYDVVSVWLNYDGMNNIIQASIGTEPVVQPPTTPASAIQNAISLGVFTDYANTISWTASPSADVAGYVIYRNGLYIARVDAMTLQFVDHNQVQSAPVTYTVAAYDSNYYTSSLLTISYP